REGGRAVDGDERVDDSGGNAEVGEGKCLRRGSGHEELSRLRPARATMASGREGGGERGGSRIRFATERCEHGVLEQTATTSARRRSFRSLTCESRRRAECS